MAPIISAAAVSGDMVKIITTTSGKAYENCRIFKLDPDGVFFAHSLGSAKVLYNDMPDSVRRRLGYDPAKAAEYAADNLSKQRRQSEQQYELRKAAVKAQAYAQEIARQWTENQPAFPSTVYAAPLNEWVGTVPFGGWTSDSFYTNEYSLGHNANWSPVSDCSPYRSRSKRDHVGTYTYTSNFDYRTQPGHYESRPRFQPNQYGANNFYAGHSFSNYGPSARYSSLGFAGSACNNYARPQFFAVPALRTATPPLAFSPARGCAVARPVVSHH